MTSLLAGRSITVIGAGTQPSRDPDAPVGNGRAIAVRAAREGASVVCVDRDEAAVEETWRLITEEGGKAAIVVADVTTEEGCRLAVSDEPGLAPDGLVLNVGTGFGMGVAGTSIDDWDKTFDLNLRAHFMLVRRALVTLADNGVDRVHGLGGRPASREPHPRLRRVQGRAHRPQPPRRGRGRPPRHPGQRARPGADRHAARPRRLRRAAVAHPHARSRWAGRARPGRWRRWPSSSFRTRRATSPGRSSPSTGG